MMMKHINIDNMSSTISLVVRSSTDRSKEILLWRQSGMPTSNESRKYFDYHTKLQYVYPLIIISNRLIITSGQYIPEGLLFHVFQINAKIEYKVNNLIIEFCLLQYTV